MPTKAKTKATRNADRKGRRVQPKPQVSAGRPINALELLEHDHREVEQLFDDFDALRDNTRKEALARRICAELTAHARIEEEIFYPEARRATKDDELLDEAIVEHAAAKHLIDEIEAMRAGDDLFDAKVRVLGELVRRHIMEEEEELFPELAGAKVDLDAMGEQLPKRKAELLHRLLAA